MAVSNGLGSIIAKYVVGEKPAICYSEDSGRYQIIIYSDEIIYKSIMDESTRCGLRVFRSTIDQFIMDLYGHNNCILQYSTRIYKDTEILTGERVRLFLKDAELDLIKIRPRYYICTQGPLRGEYIVIKSDSLDFSYKGRNYVVENMAFLMPCDAYTILDYKYLKNYRSEVADDISDIYKEVSEAVFCENLVAEFEHLLLMCANAGVSLWTLMGMIDHSMINIKGR
mgnify:FL=1|jgi:hypothetical protein